MAHPMQWDEPLPVGSAGKRSSGWWGMMMLILTEGSLFGYLLFTYLYLESQTEMKWPPEGRPELLMPGVNTVVLLASSVFVWVSERCLRFRNTRRSMISLFVAILLGTGFVWIQFNEWVKKPYGISTDLYGSLYFTITGFHMLHVLVGIVILILILGWTALGYFDHRRNAAVLIGGVYWHFVDAVWLCVFSILYLLPYL